MCLRNLRLLLAAWCGLVIAPAVVATVIAMGGRGSEDVGGAVVLTGVIGYLLQFGGIPGHLTPNIGHQHDRLVRSVVAAVGGVLVGAGVPVVTAVLSGRGRLRVVAVPVSGPQ